MRITEIKPAKLHLNSVLLSNGEEFLLDKDICTENSLCADLEIQPEKIEELKYESDYQRAKSRALWYLDRMDYTENKLYEKLISKGFDKKACSKVLAKLCEFGVVDDRRFGERMAERLLESGVSKRAALQKMLLKGLPYDLAKELLANYEVNEQSQIAEIIMKKYSSKLNEENGYQKVYAALVRKGFSYSDVSQALKKYKESEEY